MTAWPHRLTRFVRPPLMRSGTLIATLLSASLLFAAAPVHAAVHNLVFGAPYAAASFGSTSSEHYSGGSAWSKVYPGGPKFELYVDVASQFGSSFTVSQIQSITYHTLNDANNPSDVDFFLAIYTQPFGGGDAGWYGHRLNAEPLYSTAYVPPTAGVWNEWNTDPGANQLTFFDSNHCGNLGFYGAPHLQDITSGPITWSTIAGTGATATTTPIDYSGEQVLYISLQTGSGWASFEGHLDAITVSLTTGDSYVIDLEGPTDPLYVDGAWAAAAPGTEVPGGHFTGYDAFGTIQSAVDAAIPGGTVNVAAGAYVEQVVIDGKDLAVQGAGAGATTIQSPASLTASFMTGSNTNKPVVLCQNANDIHLSDLTVDGDGQGNANARFMGVAYFNAGGALLDADVLHVRNTPADGSQHGIGVYSYNTTGGPYTLECGNLNVSDFQKNAFSLSGTGMTVNVHDCTATGAGDISYTAQNGIQVGFGAAGSISDCAVSGIRYTPATYVASGILVYQPGGNVDVSGLAGSNAIASVQAPISWYDGSGTIDGVEVTGPVVSGVDFGPVFIGNFTAPAAYSATAAGNASRVPPASPVDDGAGTSMRAAATAYAAFNVSVSHGCLTGGDVAGTDGVYAYSAGGPLNVSVNNTVLADWDRGLVADGAAASLTANDNSISSNLSAGYDNSASLAGQDASNNWWGASDGPGGVEPGSGDAIVGTGVGVAPYLISGVNTSAGCGFVPPPANTIDPVPPAGCISAANSCVTVAVDISRTSSDDIRGFSVPIQLSSNLELCAGVSSITEGTYLSNVSGTTFMVTDLGGGAYTVDCAILGLPCGATAPTGNLFNISVKKAAGPDGIGTVSVGTPIARDCDNGPVAVTGGGSADVTIDTGGPAAMADLAASQVITGNDTDGTTKIQLSFTAPGDASVLEVYRAGFGNYPEYDDAPGAGAVPAIPSYPPAAPWTLTPVTANGQNDEVAVRDFYYYVAFSKDACGNVSAVSNMTGGTLNYHLGDVSDGVTAGTGDNDVQTEDISLLGSNYGISIAPSSPIGYLDVGPTTDNSIHARPTTDNKIDFEDLILFSINYGQVSAPQAALRQVAARSNAVTLQVPDLPAIGETFDVAVQLAGRGDLQGLSLELTYDGNVIEPMGFTQGDLLARQARPALLLAPDKAGLDAALLGVGSGISGEGNLATMRFRVKASGDPGLRIASLIGRDASNHPVSFEGRPAVEAPAQIPTRTSLGFAFPNPSRDGTSIELALARAGHASLDVFDLSGRRVATLLDGRYEAGVRVVQWNGRTDRGTLAPAGFYVIRLQTDGVQVTRRVQLLH